jgi:hypothetical protein
MCAAVVERTDERQGKLGDEVVKSADELLEAFSHAVG